MFFLFIPILLLFFFILFYFSFYWLNFFFIKKLIFLVVNFFNLEFLFSFCEFFVKFVFYLNFFVLIFLFLKIFFKLILFFFYFFVVDLFNVLHYIYLFVGQFYLNADTIWRHSSYMSFAHFLSNMGFVILFITFVMVLLLFQYVGDWVYFSINRDLGSEFNFLFYRYIEDFSDKEYYDIIEDESLSDETKDVLELWHYFENEPYNIFNYEDVEIQAISSNLNPDWLFSMMEHTYSNAVNKGNMFFNYDLGNEIKRIFINFIKFAIDNEFIKFINSWKILVDFFFLFIYLPCLFFVFVLFLIYQLNLIFLRFKLFITNEIFGFFK